MNDPIVSLITWTTYGSWLPGDPRGWRDRTDGNQLPSLQLKQWCKEKMSGAEILLSPTDRETVERACQEHCDFRGWVLLAVNARSNHVHLVVAANEKPQKVRDQIKANCTRQLRKQERPLVVERTWARGGDCSIIDSEQDIENAVVYVNEGQERK